MHEWYLLWRRVPWATPRLYKYSQHSLKQMAKDSQKKSLTRWAKKMKTKFVSRWVYMTRRQRKSVKYAPIQKKKRIPYLSSSC